MISIVGRCGLCLAEVESDNDIMKNGKHYHTLCYFDLFEES